MQKTVNTRALFDDLSATEQYKVNLKTVLSRFLQRSLSDSYMPNDRSFTHTNTYKRSAGRLGR